MSVLERSVSERWLLPDGVDELLPPEASAVEQLRRTILDVYASYGYELVSPPLIEYIESLLTGTGNDLDLQTFKVTDQMTGRLMGVRADITPQVARIDTHLLKSSGLSRLCYVDSVLHTKPAHTLTNRCPIQIGCELFGEANQSADVEIISLMLETLKASKIENIHVDLAHVGIYRGLIESAEFDQATEAKVFAALSRKSIPELDALAQEDSKNANIISLIRDIANLSGGVEALDKIQASVESLSLSAAESICCAISELKRISEQIQKRYTNVEIGVDFCELRGYNYHTGIMFSAFSMGYGYALAKGGRYDDIGRGFDRNSSAESRPATGFSADLKSIVRLAQLSKVEKQRIFAPAGDDPALLEQIGELRQVHCVIQALGNNDSAASLNCDSELVLTGSEWQVRPVS